MQVAVGYFLVVGLTGWFVLDLFVDQVKPGVRNTMEDTLIDSAHLVAELLAAEMERDDAPERIARALADYRQRPVDAAIWEHEKHSLDLGLYVTDADGMVLYSSDPAEVGRDYSRWNDVYHTLRGNYGARATRSDPQDPRTSVMYVAAPILSGGRIAGVVTLSRSARSIDPIIQQAKARIRAQGFLLLLAAALIGALFTWHLTRAIERLRRYARAVTDGERVSPPSSSARELAELGEALDLMRERLDGRQTVERYVHGLTHELKSPLAAIRGAAELLGEADMPADERARFLGNICAQTKRLSEVTDRLLVLARVEQLQVLSDIERLDLCALAGEAVDGLGSTADGRGARLVLECEGAVSLSADRFLLRQALSNLIHNALDFSPEGGEVRVELAVRDDGIELCVLDEGPGLPDYALVRAFERFFSLPRPDDGTKGSGLGLALVREVVELHGGRVSLENRPEGGAVALLWLPLRQGSVGA